MIIEINRIADPFISIVVPAYKEEKIVEKILSKYPRELRAKYKAELILSDGGSQDKTVELAKNYADTIVVHDEPRRQTIAEGRNAGAALARGKVIIFINCDTFPADTEAMLKYVYDWYAGANGEKYPALATRVYVKPEELGASDWLFYTFFNNYVRLLNVAGIGACRGECQIVRRDVFEKIGGYNSKLVAGEDFDLFARIRKVAKTKYTNAITVIEDPRRFRKEGYIKVMFKWSKNALKVLFSGSASDKEWEAVR